MKNKILIIGIIFLTILSISVFAQRGAEVAPAETTAASDRPINTAPPPENLRGAPVDEPIAPQEETAVAPQEETIAAPQEEPVVSPQEEPVAAPQEETAATEEEGKITTLSDFGNTEEAPAATEGTETSSIKIESFLYTDKNVIPDRQSFPLKSDKDAALNTEIQRVTNLMLGLPTTVAPDPTGATIQQAPLYSYAPSAEQAVPNELQSDLKATASWVVFWSQVDIWEDYVKSRLIQPGVVEKSYTDLWKQYAAQRNPALAETDITTSALKTLNWEVLSAIMIPDSSKVQEDLDGLYDDILEVRDLVVEQRNKDNLTFIADLENREGNRVAFEDWLNSKKKDISIFADDYIERQGGSEVTIDDTVFLISDKPLESVPIDTVNIVTDKITPYDIFKEDGTLKEPIPID